MDIVWSRKNFGTAYKKIKGWKIQGNLQLLCLHPWFVSVFLTCLKLCDTSKLNIWSVRMVKHSWVGHCHPRIQDKRDDDSWPVIGQLLQILSSHWLVNLVFIFPSCVRILVGDSHLLWEWFHWSNCPPIQKQLLKLIIGYILVLLITQ